MWRYHFPVAFSTFVMLCNHHCYLVPEHSLTPKGSPSEHSLSQPLPAPDTDPFPVPEMGPFWTCHMSGATHPVALCPAPLTEDRVLALHAPPGERRWRVRGRGNHVLFVPLWVRLLAIVGRAAVNSREHIFV